MLYNTISDNPASELLIPAALWRGLEQLLVQCLAVQSSRVIVSSCVNKYSIYNTTSLSSTMMKPKAII